MPQAGFFELQHFRLVRLPAGMASKLLAKKLIALHPRFQKKVGVPAFKTTIATAWACYNELFDASSGAGSSYERWMREVESSQLISLSAQNQAISAWKWQPLISIVLPTWNTPEAFLRECLDSVLAQSYSNWELCIADDASTDPKVRQILSEYARIEPRIQLRFSKSNGNICRASNSALEMARGEFIALLDHDDALAPHALFAIVEAIQRRPQIQIIYSDEDKLSPDGRRCDPFFKPDWSADLLYSQNYICHLTLYRRSLVNHVGGFRPGFEGSQDYDLLLRCLEHLSNPASQILHVPQILYHWRQAPGSTASGHVNKGYASAAALRALQEHMDRTSPGVVMRIVEPGIYRAHRPVSEPIPLVSLIIPTRDSHDLLRTCIGSILSKTTYPNYEILIVDNQSSCIQTLTYIRQLSETSNGKVRVLSHDKPFNYSAINNTAAQHAEGSLLGLINNDVEVISPEWLTEMVSHAIRPVVGCVGPKLYYPDGSLQHAGVVLGIGGVAGHSHKYQHGSSKGYFGRLLTTNNLSAVTGAALLVRKSVFKEVGGLDEYELTVAFNDVDFCLKVRQAGYVNVFTPFAELYHHESKTRGKDDSPEKLARFARECKVMSVRWGDLLKDDPYYNPNLTLLDESYELTSVSRPRRRLTLLAPAQGHMTPKSFLATLADVEFPTQSATAPSQ
jgi:GT2 family glycosyltransferase